MQLKSILLLFFALSLLSCHPGLLQTKNEIRKELSKQNGTFAVAYKNLASGEKILIREREVFPAASTMKTCVMIEVFKQSSEGKFKLTDSLLVRNRFKSIVDESPYSLDPLSDSDPSLYQFVGRKKRIIDLVYTMITSSSNLAANLLIDLVGPENVTQSMRKLGASAIQVRRGVEDSKAYVANLNNTTTALDLLVIFQKLGRGDVVSEESSKSMVNILLDQKFDQVIPAKLPTGIQVANKTGNYTGVRHDSGLVMIPDGRKYVIVIMSKDITDDKAAADAMANVSKLIYRRVMSSK